MRTIARGGIGSALQLREHAQDVWRLRWLDEFGQNVRYAARVLWRRPPTVSARSPCSPSASPRAPACSVRLRRALAPLASPAPSGSCSSSADRREDLVVARAFSRSRRDNTRSTGSPPTPAAARTRRRRRAVARVERGGDGQLPRRARCACRPWTHVPGDARHDRIDTIVLVGGGVIVLQVERGPRHRPLSARSGASRPWSASCLGFAFRTCTAPRIPRRRPSGDLPPARSDRHGSWFLQIIGRLRPGVTARAGGQTIYSPSRRPSSGAIRTATASIRVVTPLVDDVAIASSGARGARRCRCAVSLLVVACTNAAHAVPGTRGRARDRELAVRLASRQPRTRRAQLVTESVVLAAVSRGWRRHRRHLAHATARRVHRPATRIPRLEPCVVDAPVLAFAVLLTLVVGVLFGSRPGVAEHACQSARPARVVRPGTRHLVSRDRALAEALLSRCRSRPRRCCSSAPCCWTQSRATHRQ